MTAAREVVYAAVTADLHGEPDLGALMLSEYPDPAILAGAAVGLASAFITRMANEAGRDPRDFWAEQIAEIEATRR